MKGTPQGGQGSGIQPNSGNSEPGKQVNDTHDQSFGVAQQQQQQTQAPTFQIDPRFQSLPAQEAIARTVQSIVTPLNQQLAEYENKSKKWDEYIDSLSELFDPKNTEVRMAFIREMAPDLVPSVDIDTKVQKELEKLFGEGFKPDKAEADSDHFSKSARYMRKLNVLYEKYETETPAASKTYSEIKREAAAKEAARVQENNAKERELRTKFNISDSEFKIFAEWSQKLNLEDLYYHFKGIQVQNGVGNIGGIGSQKLSKVDKFEKINSLFGK